MQNRLRTRITQLANAFPNREIPTIVVFSTAILVWLRIIFIGSFGDERENFVAGWFVSEGLIPYKDFFFHHGPLPFFLASIGYFFDSQPWYLFRCFIFGWWTLIGVITLFFILPRLRLGIAFVWLMYALSAPLFHLHFLLAESIVLPVLIAVMLLLYSAWRYQQPRVEILLILWIVGGWVAAWSSIIAVPPLGIMLIGVLALCIRAGYTAKHGRRSLLRRLLTKRFIRAMTPFASWFLFLNGIFPAYFLWHSALPDAWWAIVRYNTEYYFPLRLAHTPSQAAVGYLSTMMTTFFQNLFTQWDQLITATLTALQTLLGLFRLFLHGTFAYAEWLIIWTEWYPRIATPEGITTIVLTSIVGYLLMRRHWLAGLWLLLFLVSLRGRDNELFKLGLYYLPIISLGMIALAETFFHKKRHISTAVTILMGGWIVFVAPTYFQSLEAPSNIIPSGEIVLAGKIDDDLERLTNSKKVLFLGGNPDYYLLTKKTPAFRYYYYHPWFHAVPTINEEMRAFLRNNNSAPVVVESEIEGTSFAYASDLHEILIDKYALTAPGIYIAK